MADNAARIGFSGFRAVKKGFCKEIQINRNVTGIIGKLNNLHQIKVDATQKLLKRYRLNGESILFYFF